MTLLIYRLNKCKPNDVLINMQSKYHSREETVNKQCIMILIHEYLNLTQDEVLVK